MCTSANGRGLVHYGLLHPPSADLAGILAPLIAERLDSGQPVLAVLSSPIAAHLQGRLTTRRGLHTVDPDGLYRHPGRVLSHYLGWIAETSPSEPATIVAAPKLDHQDDSHRAALWMHIDALATQALAECDLTLVCAYPDDPATAPVIRRAHPSLFNGEVTPNPDHIPAEQFVTSYPLPPPNDLGHPEATHIIDYSSQLSDLRTVVNGYGIRVGLPATRCEDFVLAVNEIATNALEHGVPPAVVCLWATPTSVICQITDNGRFNQPLAGLMPPRPNQPRTYGLWMAHQLCDQLYLWPQPATVRLQMDRPQDKD